MITSETHADALAQLKKAASRSKRTNVAFSQAFIRTTAPPLGGSATPPLVALIQGGRGGEVRLKLYLLLTMMATMSPFDIQRPPTARLLARTLELPTDTGPRRINSNLRWLRDKKFLSLTKQTGRPAAIQLLDPQGTGEILSDPRSTRPYVTLPIGFWADGWLLDLSPRAIAVLLALRERLGGVKQPVYMLRDRRASYGLSHDTWTRGEQELSEHGLLNVTRTPQGDGWDYMRLRNSYELNEAKLAYRSVLQDAVV
ncbi:hypothetical protein [Fodinicola acaciae]|uniref:hypothetical protein n=1 Tax=Fodinicola acaciae TaxID=2681555 RepID=UPI0013D56910|nr:hypothetical protein [Fodinicola acaciae]